MRAIAPPALILILIVLLAAPVAMTPLPVSAQQTPLNRCIGPSGGTIYTDRRCDAIGSSDRVQRGASAVVTGGRRSGCARNLQDLIFEITTSIDTHDANRLGSVYHWVGQDQASGDRILDRLQAVVDRPLVDIAVLRLAVPAAEPPLPASPSPPMVPPSESPPPLAGTDQAASTSMAPATSASNTDTDVAPVRPRARSGAIGLRLEQTLLKSATPSRTLFRLHRNLDCWWISF